MTAKLNIGTIDTCVAAMDGRVAQPADVIPDGAHINVFQVSHGG